MSKNDFLLEIGTEEIPARFMNNLLTDLYQKTTTALEKNHFSFGKAQTFGTYRRMTILINNLSEKQPDITQKVKGPPANIGIDNENNYLPPAQGFAKRLNIPVEELKIEEENGNKYLFATTTIKSQSVFEVLPKLLPEIICSINLPIAMKWGSNTMQFIRPVHWIVSLYGNQIIPFELFNTKASNYTFGHRFLTKNENSDLIASGVQIKLSKAADYETQLKRHYVLADPQKRRTIIKNFVDNNTETSSANLGLLEETTYLTEQPYPIIGNFDEKYLELPAEILIQCMKKHQKYFPVIKNNALTAQFICIAENLTIKSSANIISGNEQVLTARLEDLRFFWKEDLENNLDFYAKKLDNIVFQKNMGSISDKIKRLKILANPISKSLNYEPHLKDILRTIELSKADLSTQMVFELPNLQGVIGRLYAEQQQENKLVSQGIEEHYLPKHSHDQLPESPTGIAVSIADKIDSIVCSFYNGLIPTGSQDPWGIRRDIYGILQIIINKEFSISITDLIDNAYNNLGNEHKNKSSLITFFQQRLKSFLIDTGIPYDAVEATLESALDNPVNAKNISSALNTYRDTNLESFKLLTDTAVRINRLSPKEKISLKINPEHFELNDEHTCLEAYNVTNKQVQESIKAGHYEDIISTLANLSAPLTTYFDNVLVMSKNPKVKENRLSFLKLLNNLFRQCADFEKIVI